MKYPCFRLSQGRTALANHKDQAGSTLSAVSPEQRNAEGDLDNDEVEDLLRDLTRRINANQANRVKSKGVSQDQVEGILALDLYRTLAPLPAQCLADPDFWRFVSVELVRDFVFWRDGEDCSYASFGLSSARRIPDCVPLRMFNRAHIANSVASESEMMASDVVTAGGADFWQSHVLRVQNRFDPRLVAQLVIGLESGDISNVQELREIAKDIRRLRANVVLELQDDPVKNESLQMIVDSQSGRK